MDGVFWEDQEPILVEQILERILSAEKDIQYIMLHVIPLSLCNEL